MSGYCIKTVFSGPSGEEIYLTHWRPQGIARKRTIIMVPPFAEEMNKSRWMLAEVARELARRGVSSVLPDLYGTGDSQGNFVDATWARWKSDIHAAIEWSATEGHPVDGVLAVRLGCALAMDVLSDIGPPIAMGVLWQPAMDGAQFLRQFLRLRTAAAAVQDKGSESIGGLRQRLLEGLPCEVAGYEISGELATELERAPSTDSKSFNVSRLTWIEVARDQGSELKAASRDAIRAIRAHGTATEVRLVSGEPFWSTTEICRNFALINNTIEAFDA